MCSARRTGMPFGPLQLTGSVSHAIVSPTTFMRRLARLTGRIDARRPGVSPSLEPRQQVVGEQGEAGSRANAPKYSSTGKLRR